MDIKFYNFIGVCFLVYLNSYHNYDACFSNYKLETIPQENIIVNKLNLKICIVCIYVCMYKLLLHCTPSALAENFNISRMVCYRINRDRK